jgi:hypothetical protein
LTILPIKKTASGAFPAAVLILLFNLKAISPQTVYGLKKIPEKQIVSVCCSQLNSPFYGSIASPQNLTVMFLYVKTNH